MSNNWGGKRAGAGRKKLVAPSNVAFEGGQDGYGRTFIYMPCYAAEEFPAYNRQRLLEKSRWLVNNSGVAKRAIDGVSLFAVGNGISPQARTANREWNQEVEEVFEARCGTAAFGFDVAAQVNFYEAQSLVLKQILTDGDFFAQLMRSEAGSGMMRFISGEYCQTKLGRLDEERFNDGVETNAFGKPLNYQFIVDSKLQTYQTIPAEDIVHFKRVHRHGYVRGVPALHHAVNHIHDMTDTLSFTKGSFKLASQIAFVLESPEAGNIGLGANVLKRTFGSNAAQVTHDVMYPLAGHVQTKPGDKLTALKNEHPGASFDPFMNFLIRDIAMGIGISPELLWNLTMTGGAVVRGIFATDQVFLDSLQQLLINQFCRRYWIFWLWHEIQKGTFSYPGDDWWKHDWIPPARITVDFAKDGKLLADLCDRGLLSPDRYYGMQGYDAETEELAVIRRRARRKAMVEQIAAEEGVELTVEECFPPPPGSTNVNQTVDNQDQNNVQRQP